jgi:hypothetical protein
MRVFQNNSLIRPTNRRRERADNNNSRDKNPHLSEPNNNNPPTANQEISEINADEPPEDRLLRIIASNMRGISVFRC